MLDNIFLIVSNYKIKLLKTTLGFNMLQKVFWYIKKSFGSVTDMAFFYKTKKNLKGKNVSYLSLYIFMVLQKDVTACLLSHIFATHKTSERTNAFITGSYQASLNVLVLIST